MTHTKNTAGDCNEIMAGLTRRMRNFDSHCTHTHIAKRCHYVFLTLIALINPFLSISYAKGTSATRP